MIFGEINVPTGSGMKSETLYECPSTGLRLLAPQTNLETVRDGRGVILSWVPDEKIAEFNIVHFRPSCVRGMHYHDHFIEYSLCVNGHGMFVYRTDRNDPASEKSLNMAKGFCVRIPKGVVHTIYSIDELTIVALLTQEWHISDPPIVQVGDVPKPK